MSCLDFQRSLPLPLPLPFLNLSQTSPCLLFWGFVISCRTLCQYPQCSPTLCLAPTHSTTVTHSIPFYTHQKHPKLTLPQYHYFFAPFFQQTLHSLSLSSRPILSSQPSLKIPLKLIKAKESLHTSRDTTRLGLKLPFPPLRQSRQRASHSRVLGK